MEAPLMTRNMIVGRSALLALGSAALFLAFCAAARADCGDDLKKLTERRVSLLNEINTMAAASKKAKKPMEPGIVCAKARGLTSAENALLAYMDKNKDWCGIPDEVLQSLKTSHAKTLDFGNRACVAAAKFKKMQEQQAAGGAPGGPPPLPAGPL
ncbi:MAG TPA: hypothetical protein VKV96_11515 [Roseiarcus sp.]|nr:hypothetical protein [Roseiarcus sp.]